MTNQPFKGWKSVSEQMHGFSARQCRDRWHNYLSPKICPNAWTIEEDYILLTKVQEIGTRWSEISTFLPGRSDNNIKNRWNYVVKYKEDILYM